MSDIQKLGKLLDGTEKRDAVHIAIAPVICGDGWIGQGESVRFAKDSTERVVKCEPSSPLCIGIADPFLTTSLYDGDRFYVWLKPGSLSTLRHEWTHPLFEKKEIPPPTSAVEEAKQWLSQFADDGDMDYDTLMSEVGKFLEDGENEIHTEGMLRTFKDEKIQAFWHHYQIVTGVVVDDPDKRFFSCCGGSR